MRLSNELRVGIAVVAAAVVFVLGIRYFANLPLFRGTYDLVTSFSDAGGLVEGSPVRIQGINVGSITEISLDPQTRNVVARFQVDRRITVPEGSTALAGGIAALGSVYLVVELGPPGNAPVDDGGFIPGREDAMTLGSLTDRAPQLVNRVDSTLVAASYAFGEAGNLLNDPDSDLRLTLAGLRNVTRSLDRVLQAEQGRLSSVLSNVDSISGDLKRFTGENADSLEATVQNLNQVLRRLNQNLDALDGTTLGLDSLIEKVNRGEGTLGLLVNDPTMYYRLDSLTTSLNRILMDFERDPRRYLKELKLIDLF